MCGAKRLQKAVSDWRQKEDLQPANDASLDHVTVNETMIRINGQQFRLYTAVDPEMNVFLYMRPLTTTMAVLAQQYLGDLHEKHDVSDAAFSLITQSI